LIPSIFSNHILDSVTPIQFKDTILIPIKLDIVKLFRKKDIEFQIIIEDKKIIIESPEILASLDIQDNTPVQEIINID